MLPCPVSARPPLTVGGNDGCGRVIPAGTRTPPLAGQAYGQAHGTPGTDGCTSWPRRHGPSAPGRVGIEANRGEVPAGHRPGAVQRRHRTRHPGPGLSQRPLRAQDARRHRGVPRRADDPGAGPRGHRSRSGRGRHGGDQGDAGLPPDRGHSALRALEAERAGRNGRGDGGRCHRRRAQARRPGRALAPRAPCAARVPAPQPLAQGPDPAPRHRCRPPRPVTAGRLAGQDHRDRHARPAAVDP